MIGQNEKSIIFDLLDKSEPTLVAPKSLVTPSLAYGHIFYPRKKAGPLLLIAAGDFIHKEKIKKYLDGSLNEFLLVDVANQNTVRLIKDYFKMFDSEKNESAKFVARENFNRWFADVYIYGVTKSSVLDYNIAAFETFYKLPDEVINVYLENSLEVLTRSLTCASMAVAFAIYLGFVDIKVLSDIYNISLLKDLSLVKLGLDYNTTQELRNYVGTEQDLSQKLSKHDHENYININQNLKDIFTFPKMAQSIIYHHMGITTDDQHTSKMGWLNHWDIILCIVDRMMPFEKQTYFPEDGTRFIFEQFRKLNRTKSKNELQRTTAYRLLERWILDEGTFKELG